MRLKRNEKENHYPYYFITIFDILYGAASNLYSSIHR